MPDFPQISDNSVVFCDPAFIFNRELKARLDRREILVLMDPREER